jgi:hypothetical protein
MKIIAALACLALAGCAELEPNAVGVEVDHTSHVLQHFIQADRPGDQLYGHETLALVAHWEAAEPDGKMYMDMTEGVSAGSKIDDETEVFNLRIGYLYQLK